MPYNVTFKTHCSWKDTKDQCIQFEEKDDALMIARALKERNFDYWVLLDFCFYDCTDIKVTYTALPI